MLLARLVLLAVLLVPLADPIRADRLGVTFMSSAQAPADPARYEAALATGAGWNRWPLYWYDIEPAPGAWNWSAYDRVAAADLVHGLKVDAILMGVPADYRGRGGVPEHLDAPIFDDGTDTPGLDKAINPENVWATFVYRTVQRYKPGGALGTLLHLRPDQGIRTWEIWNEPDYRFFWGGSVAEYVRLLKVAALAVRHADPEAVVVFGGLSFLSEEDWLAESLAHIAEDPDHEAHGWYFDVVAVHHYSFALGTWQRVQGVKETLAEYEIGRPVWVNESGVPVWDDYPGPTWDDEDARLLRATQEEQAAFVIQSAVYAFAAGAERFFYHQLYDDCGNQPSGTDFFPHDGALCEETPLCWGDAHGLYRNAIDSVCFSHHPQPDTPRPVLAAFGVLAEVFGTAPFAFEELENRGPDGLQTWATFRRPETGERILALWNRRGLRAHVRVPAAGDRAALYDASGYIGMVEPEDGVYRLTLPAATNETVPALPEPEKHAIGGVPYILVEAP